MPKSVLESAVELRQLAEEKCRSEVAATAENRSPEETTAILHELRVHQIELEMQNEELRRTQHDLAEAKAHYFDLYDLAPVCYLTLNDDWLILDANLTTATMLGVPRNSLVKKTLSQFIYCEDQDLYYLQQRQCFKYDVPHSWEMRMVRSDGIYVWVLAQVTSARNGQYWVTLSDITKIKQAEAENVVLQQQFQQAQKLESLGVLAGGVAHDFNNILTIIMGYCSLSELHPEKALEQIPEIQKSAERAAALCRQMLAYAGKATLVMQQVNLYELIHDLIQMLQSSIRQNVTIKTVLPANIPAVKADASQIRQIVMNLIINASEAIDDAFGEITVSLAPVEVDEANRGKDHMGQNIAFGRYVCLTVSDNGCGMSDETKFRIFEPFYSTKFTGRGLGMSAVLGIIIAHKGALQLSSQPGLGTTFKVYLPVSDAIEQDTTVCSTHKEWQGSGTVLLVEDEEMIMIIADIMLNELGFDVIKAVNGKEALELYKKNVADINLVVTDIGMPVMDGYQLFRELKKRDPELPIIISSGFGDTLVVTQIPRDEIAGLVSKPYNYDQLRDVLKKCCANRQGAGCAVAVVTG